MCTRLLLALWLSCLLAFPLAAEQPEERLYLITETEVQSIEEYRKTSELEKQNSLSQVRELKNESILLNSQLAQAREDLRRSNQSFNELEAERLTQLALKDGEIADLKLENSKEKGTSQTRLVVIIALAGAWVVFIGFKACRFFRPTPKLL